jgi:hypothetical protein
MPYLDTQATTFHNSVDAHSVQYQLCTGVSILTSFLSSQSPVCILLHPTNKMVDGRLKLSILCWDFLLLFSSRSIKMYTARFLFRKDALMKNIRCGLGRNQKKTINWFGFIVCVAVCIFSSMKCSCSMLRDFRLLA